MGLFDTLENAFGGGSGGFSHEEAAQHYQNVYTDEPHHKSSLTHEAIAGAAGFAAMRAYESHLRATGQQPSHELMKEILAGIASAEVDKLAETKGLDWLDRHRAKKMATAQAHQLAAQRYGGGTGYEYAASQGGPSYEYNFNGGPPYGMRGCPSYGYGGGGGGGYGGGGNYGGGYGGGGGGGGYAPPPSGGYYPPPSGYEPGYNQPPPQGYNQPPPQEYYGNQPGYGNPPPQGYYGNQPGYDGGYQGDGYSEPPRHHHHHRE